MIICRLNTGYRASNFMEMLITSRVFVHLVLLLLDNLLLLSSSEVDR